MSREVGKDGLTDLERRFLAEMRNPERRGKAAECLRVIGYSPNRERCQEYAKELLKRPIVKWALDAMRADDSEDAGVTIGRIKKRMAQVMDGKAPHCVGAANLLAKMTPGALVPQKLEHSGVLGVSLDQLVPKRKRPTEGER